MHCRMKLLIHSQTSTVAPLKLGMDQWFHPTPFWACSYLSMLWLKLIHVSDLDKSDMHFDLVILLGGLVHITEHISQMKNILRGLWAFDFRKDRSL